MRAKFPYLFLLGIVFLMFLTNYQPGTWLSGWDNLHPEFNFLLNINRSFFSAWQEYQGLGLLGGMGHGSDLIRQIILWLISFIVPNSFSRYLFHFSMLLVGAIGVYKLLDYLLTDGDRKKIACLAGGVFYLFNLATLQMFYVPLEVYSSHFAFLPWLFWANLKFLETGGKRSFLLLVLINIFALSQGYVATYFLVYFMALFLVFFSYLIWKKKQALVRIIIAVITVLTINSFWLLPNLYFVATNSEVNLDAKINQMATEDNFLKNQKFGDLKNTTLLKGFWFDNVEITQEGNSEYQFKPWINYFNNFPIPLIGYFLFLTALSGVVISIIKRRTKIVLFIPVFLLSFVLLSNNTPVLSSLGEWFYKIPLFSQIFRYPFTKFAILIAFCLSLFYALCLNELIHCLNKKLLKIIFSSLFIFLPIIYLFPVFQGNLFYQKEKAKIPDDYFQLMNYLKTQNPNTRIANFPQSTFWGWNFYRFNYSGSGFLWYGVNQPILDRAFDVWSRENENYYWEASYALYSKNQNLFEKVFEKYQIKWLLVDENIVSPSSSKSLYVDELKELLANSNRFKLDQQFGNISLYRFQPENPIKNYVFMVDNLPNVLPNYKWNNFDQAYLDNGAYTGEMQNVIRDMETYYPFRSLFTGKKQEEIEFKVEETEDSLVLKKVIPSNYANYQLILPEKRNEELIFVDPNDLTKTIFFKPEISFEGDLLKVKVPKIKGLYGVQINPINENSTLEAKNCNKFSKGEVSNQIISGDSLLRLNSTNALNCSQAFSFLNLPHNLSYLITVKSRNVNGKSLLFWLENPQSRKADMETYLPQNQDLSTSYFIQPPMTNDGLGYILHFDNNSIGERKTVNDLGEINLYQIPYYFLTSLKLVSSENQKQESNFIVPDVVEHPNSSLYKIQLSSTINHSPKLTIVLSQSYNEGWQAYFGVECGIMNKELCGLLAPVFGERIKDHVFVNNWENGWNLDPLTINHLPSTIYLVYLPQYLEYLGFGLIILIFPSFFLLKKLLH